MPKIDRQYRFDVRQFVRRVKGEVTLPIIQDRFVASNQYVAILNSLLKGIVSYFRQTVLPAYTVYISDAEDDGSWFIALEKVVPEYVAEAKGKVEPIIRSEARYHTKKFKQGVKKKLKTNIDNLINEQQLENVIQDSIDRNGSLIKGLADDTLKGIKETVFSAKSNGQSVRTLASRLRYNFDISSKRAKFIARDQMAKLNADLNKSRSQQIGSDYYYWRDMGDSRVRPLHRTLNGRKYRWDESTDAEGGLEPGGPPNCRCIAETIIDF